MRCSQPLANKRNFSVTMRILLLISLQAVASLAMLSSATPPDAQYRVHVENGTITLFSIKSGELLARTTFERWGIVSPTRDKLRHVALDLTAAVVAGNGGREHSVDPNLPVCTCVENETIAEGSCLTATVEHGLAFVIFSDTERPGRYEAFIIGSGRAEVVPTPLPTQTPNQSLNPTKKSD